MTPNNMGISLSGKWRDRVYRHGELVHDTGICNNQIQDSAFLVISALLNNQFINGRRPAETLYSMGITHIEYGSGSATWDATDPEKPTSQTTLTNAVYRQPISDTEISFVPDGDAFGGTQVSALPTSRLRIVKQIGENDYNGELREFGLFCTYGTDDNDQLNYGKIFNWVVHPLIVKDDTITIERVIEITITRG